MTPEYIFSTALRRARLRAGLTQQDLADKLFMTQQAINKWENGESLPRLDKLKELVEILDLDAYEMIFEPSDTTKEDLILLAQSIEDPHIREQAITEIRSLPKDTLTLWKYDKRYDKWLRYQLQEILLKIYRDNNGQLLDDYLLRD